MTTHFPRPLAGRAVPDRSFPRPTAAQIRERNAADCMMIDAVAAAETHRVVDVMFAALSARFSAGEVEQIANLLGRKAHEAGRAA